MKRNHFITLFLLGAFLGGVSGALASTIKNEGKDMVIWASTGASILSVASCLTKGRILSLIFITNDWGSAYKGNLKGEWKYFWIVSGFLGPFIGSLNFGWIDRISNEMMYIVFPFIAIISFGLGYLLHQVMNLYGCICFGIIGLIIGYLGFTTI